MSNGEFLELNNQDSLNMQFKESIMSGITHSQNQKKLL